MAFFCILPKFFTVWFLSIYCMVLILVTLVFKCVDPWLYLLALDIVVKVQTHSKRTKFFTPLPHSLCFDALFYIFVFILLLLIVVILLLQIFFFNLYTGLSDLQYFTEDDIYVFFRFGKFSAIKSSNIFSLHLSLLSFWNPYYA